MTATSTVTVLLTQDSGLSAVIVLPYSRSKYGIILMQINAFSVNISVTLSTAQVQSWIWISECELSPVAVGNSVRSETNGPKFKNHPIST